jgi:hypothetical protein
VEVEIVAGGPENASQVNRIECTIPQVRPVIKRYTNIRMIQKIHRRASQEGGVDFWGGKEVM